MENSTWDGEVREAEAAENTTDEVDSENTECESESAVTVSYTHLWYRC